MKEWFFSSSSSVYPMGVNKVSREMLKKYEASKIYGVTFVKFAKCELFVPSFPETLTFFKKGV